MLYFQSYFIFLRIFESFHSTLENPIMMHLQKVLNIVFIIAICLILGGAYLYQFIKFEKPCPLCLLQRLGMIAIAVALFMNVRFGIKPEHYGLAIISALLGMLVSLRQISLHICPQFPPFGQPILGYDLYFWSFIVFISSIFACAFLLMIHGFTKHKIEHIKHSLLETLLFALLACVILSNIITTLYECGFASCSG